MRVLLLNQFFYPDSAPTSRLLTDLARRLAADGHSVRVISGSSAYAAPDLLDPPAVEIVRTLSLPFGRGPLARVFSYASFFCGAIYHSLLGPKPGIVLTLTTPPALSVVGSLLKSIYHTRHFIWEMDLYPDIAIDLGVLRSSSWLTRGLGAALDWSRRSADGVIALGECMRDRLIRRGIPVGRISIAENWVDSSAIRPLPFPAFRVPLTVLYSGNLGLAHDVDTVRAAIFHFRSDSRFNFVFAGGGPQRGTLESFCRKHEAANVSFSGYRSHSDLAQRLGACHVGLVTQKAATVGSVVPSKTYGLMAAGRPILYIGPREATPARIVRRFRCGWQIDPGDTAALIDLLERLVTDWDQVREAGARGHNAFLRHYDLPIGTGRICKILESGAPHTLAEVGAAAGSRL